MPGQTPLGIFHSSKQADLEGHLSVLCPGLSSSAGELAPCPRCSISLSLSLPLAIGFVPVPKLAGTSASSTPPTGAAKNTPGAHDCSAGPCGFACAEDLRRRKGGQARPWHGWRPSAKRVRVQEEPQSAPPPSPSCVAFQCSCGDCDGRLRGVWGGRGRETSPLVGSPQRLNRLCHQGGLGWKLSKVTSQTVFRVVSAPIPQGRGEPVARRVCRRQGSACVEVTRGGAESSPSCVDQTGAVPACRLPPAAS